MYFAWAAEHATSQECAIICQKWLALRPEEQTKRGWRKALYCALSDGEGIKATQKVKSKSRKKEDEGLEMFNLFDLIGND